MVRWVALVVVGVVVGLVGFFVDNGWVTFVGALLVAAAVLSMFAFGQHTRPGPRGG